MMKRLTVILSVLGVLCGSLTAAAVPKPNFIVNQWVNRLVGDLKLPKAERKIYTSVLDGPPPARKDPRSPHRLADPDADQYLRASGLIGPVELRFSRIHSFSP